MVCRMASHKIRVKILTGSHAGEVVDAVGCNARPYPNCPPEEVNWELWGDGIYVESLALRLKYDPYHPQYENLHVPFDRYNQEIFVGDLLLIARAEEVETVKVLGLGKVYHAGCGWYQRKLKVVRCAPDADDLKPFQHNYPARSIKISQPLSVGSEEG